MRATLDTSASLSCRFRRPLCLQVSPPSLRPPPPSSCQQDVSPPACAFTPYLTCRSARSFHSPPVTQRDAPLPPSYLQISQLIGPPPRPLSVLGGDQVLRLSQLTGQQAHLHV